jgi:hypothetical protein
VLPVRLPGLSLQRFPFVLLPVLRRGWLGDLPGAAQRRRALAAAVLAALALLLRPWPPFQWLPGWCVGGLLLWAVLEAWRWSWRPRRWR